MLKRSRWKHLLSRWEHSENRAHRGVSAWGSLSWSVTGSPSSPPSQICAVWAVMRVLPRALPMRKPHLGGAVADAVCSSGASSSTTTP